MEKITEKELEFLNELKSLLEKHDATIGFNCADCSDTYGLYEERIVAQVGRGKEISMASGWDCGAENVTETIKHSKVEK
jgi:hypothetical protein|nr:MAG TPA: 33 kDa chaperonin [Caudoviricetes sp.]